MMNIIKISLYSLHFLLSRASFKWIFMRLILEVRAHLMENFHWNMSTRMQLPEENKLTSNEDFFSSLIACEIALLSSLWHTQNRPYFKIFMISFGCYKFHFFCLQSKCHRPRNIIVKKVKHFCGMSWRFEGRKNERAGHKKVQEVLRNSFKFILFHKFSWMRPFAPRWAII